MGGSQGEIRMLGLNVTGKQIIEEQKGTGKYIALVGASALSSLNLWVGLARKSRG